jgi:glycosyltransferase involved in cell wall biosynthesis
MRELLYVYKIASFGGVERVLLNRAEAFRRHRVACRLSLYFYKDEGALASIRDYITERGLAGQIQVVNRIDAAAYDHVIAIDTPEVLDAGVPEKKIVFECHTTYHESRRYLANLPDNIPLVVVPSVAALKEVAEQFPQLREKLLVMHNCVYAEEACAEEPEPFWAKRPLLYLGRMDAHKNFTEVLDIFSHYRECYGDDLFLLLVGPVVKGVNLDVGLAKRHLASRVVVLPPVRFDRIWQIYSLVKRHRGLFISASRAESFGLSAAESLAAGLPVLLSGIPAHLDLVAGTLDYVYPLGDSFAGARKLRKLVEHYDQAAVDATKFSRQFAEELFLSDWQRYDARMSGMNAPNAV